MISKFDTTASAVPATKGSSNGILYLVVGAVVLYLGYKYIIKPQMEKNKAEAEKK